jgi:hypothetical protein
MGAVFRQRRLKEGRSWEETSWMEPKRRFYLCLFVFMIFCVLQRWNWIFSLGAFGTIAAHAGIALYAGNIYVRTLSLRSADVIYRREDPAYSVALVIHFGILLLFLLTLLLRIGGL